MPKSSLKSYWCYAATTVDETGEKKQTKPNKQRWSYTAVPKMWPYMQNIIQITKLRLKLQCIITSFCYWDLFESTVTNLLNSWLMVLHVTLLRLDTGYSLRKTMFDCRKVDMSHIDIGWPRRVQCCHLDSRSQVCISLKKYWNYYKAMQYWSKFQRSACLVFSGWGFCHGSKKSGQEICALTMPINWHSQ